MAEAHFKKKDGIFTATIKRGSLTIEISFSSDDSADETEMEENLQILHANLVLTCGEEEAARVFQQLSAQMNK